MAMVTVAQFREYMDKIGAGTPIDNRITAILGRAEDIVVEALGFTFFASDAPWSGVTASAKRVQSERSIYLRLPPYLAASITSVLPITGVTVGTSEVTEYEEQDHFYLYRPAGWGGSRYAITAKWGYGPAPAALVELILELAINIERQKAQGLFQVQMGVDPVGQAVGGGGIKYVGGLNADQRRIVANIRRHYIESVH